MNWFWANFSSTFDFAAASAILAMAIFVCLWTGVLSFTPIPLAAVGAFAMSYFYVRLQWSFYAAAAVALVCCAAISFSLSYLLLRLDSHYLALATIALILMTRVVVLNAGSYTGGVFGQSVPATVPRSVLYALLGVSALLLASLRGSRYGIAAEAVRHEPAVAATLGIDPMRIQRIGFVISGVLAGLGGLLLANLYQYINADTYSSDLAFVTLAAVVLGGAYHWAGAIIGTAIYALIPKLISYGWPDERNVLNGIILIVIMLLLPGGLVDPSRRARRVERRDANSEVAAAGSAGTGGGR